MENAKIEIFDKSQLDEKGGYCKMQLQNYA